MGQTTRAFEYGVSEKEFDDLIERLTQFELKLRSPRRLGGLLSEPPLSDPCGEWETLRKHSVFIALFASNTLLSPAFRAFCERRKLNGSSAEEQKLEKCFLEARFI